MSTLTVVNQVKIWLLLFLIGCNRRGFTHSPTECHKRMCSYNVSVMYETMEVYPLSWVYYLTFIFFTAFAFLNMVIGIVVNVMERENEKARAEKAALLKAEKEAEGYREVTLELLMSELQAIKAKIDHKEK